MNNEALMNWVEQIFRRRTLALRVGLLVFGVIAVGSLLWAPSYESVSEILVQSNRAQLLVSPGLKEDAANQATQTVPVGEQDLNSEVELLTSPIMIQQALAGDEIECEQRRRARAGRISGEPAGRSVHGDARRSARNFERGRDTQDIESSERDRHQTLEHYRGLYHLARRGLGAGFPGAVDDLVPGAARAAVAEPAGAGVFSGAARTARSTLAAIGKRAARRAIADRNLAILGAATGADKPIVHGRGELPRYRGAGRFQHAANRQPGSASWRRRRSGNSRNRRQYKILRCSS